jgi:hypothetical protein
VRDTERTGHVEEVLEGVAEALFEVCGGVGGHDVAKVFHQAAHRLAHLPPLDDETLRRPVILRGRVRPLLLHWEREGEMRMLGGREGVCEFVCDGEREGENGMRKEAFSFFPLTIQLILSLILLMNLGKREKKKREREREREDKPFFCPCFCEKNKQIRALNLATLFLFWPKRSSLSSFVFKFLLRSLFILSLFLSLSLILKEFSFI